MTNEEASTLGAGDIVYYRSGDIKVFGIVNKTTMNYSEFISVWAYWNYKLGEDIEKFISKTRITYMDSSRVERIASKIKSHMSKFI